MDVACKYLPKSSYPHILFPRNSEHTEAECYVHEHKAHTLALATRIPEDGLILKARLRGLPGSGFNSWVRV